MNKKRILFTAVIAVIVVVAAIYYVKLGGFNPMHKSVEEQPELYFSGQKYYGLTTDDSLREIMGSVFQEVQRGRLEGTFSVCHIGNPDQDRYPISVWVGTTQESPQKAVPELFDQWRLPAREVVRATINSYSIVAPNPNKVNEELRNLAQKRGLTLDSLYLERYFSEEKIFNEIYVD